MRWFRSWFGTSRQPAAHRLSLEELEGRWVPTSLPPGNYSGAITSNSEFDQTGTYNITGNLTVNPGVTLTIAAGASVVIKNDVTLTVAVNGTLRVTSPTNPVRVEEANFSNPQGITVNGTMAVTGTTGATFAFSGSQGNDASLIQVNAGGRLTASNSTFGWDQLVLANGSLLSAGDLTGNGFDTTLFVPANFVPLLASNLRFQDVNLNANSPIGTTLNLVPLGTANPAGQRYVLSGNLTVPAGSTLSVAANANVLITNDVTLTVANNATLTVTSPAAFLVQEANFSNPQGITVNGTMTVTSTTFGFFGGQGNDTSLIRVNSGGHLTASASTFGWDQLVLENGSVLNAGDLTGNGFDTTLFVPANFVPLLASNLRFQDVNLNANSPIGTTLNLVPLGTANPASQRYVLSGNLTVPAGTTVNVGANARVLLRNDITLTVANNGTLTVTSPAEFQAEEANFSNPQGITVDGTMTVTGAAFGFFGNQGNDTSLIRVRAGGRLTASASTFGWDQLVLENNSVLNAGDLTGNGFDTTLFVPANFVPLLANNKRFQDVNLNANSPTGTLLNLVPLGTDNPASQRYVFSGALTVPAGATVNVGTNARVLIRNDVTLTVDNNGTLTVTRPAEFQVEEANFSNPQGVTVNGTMIVTNTTFNFFGNQGNDTSLIQVNAGGRLTATGSTFGWDQVVLANGSLLSAGNLTGNGFDTTLFVPADFVPLLANNLRFQDVNLNANSPTGTVLNLVPLGTANPASQRYVFSGNLTVPAGATVNVGANANVVITNDVTLTVAGGGTLTVTSPAAFQITEANFSNPQGITVNGTMVVTSSTFGFLGSPGNDTSLIQVNAGGRLDVSGSTVRWDSLTVNAGAVATIKYVALSGQLALNSGATFSAAQNDFGGLAANAVVATGAATATIDLTNNYWGTTNAATINGYVLDHLDDATRPTVVFQPLRAARPVPVLVAVNGGAFQRSMVTSLTVTFDRVVAFAGPVAQAFTLARKGDGAAVNFTASQVTVNNGTQTQVTLTGFTGTATSSASLADGRYTLTALAGQVRTAAGASFLDGNGDGTAADTAADNFVFDDSGTLAGDQLHRLFGDSNGDRRVDSLDFFQFRSTFGLASGSPAFLALFDVNGDGTVDNADFFQFRIRFGTSV